MRLNQLFAIGITSAVLFSGLSCSTTEEQPSSKPRSPSQSTEFGPRSSNSNVSEPASVMEPASVQTTAKKKKPASGQLPNAEVEVSADMDAELLDDDLSNFQKSGGSTIDDADESLEPEQ